MPSEGYMREGNAASAIVSERVLRADDARRAGAVRDAFDSQSDTIVNLQEAIASLAEKLVPILRPSDSKTLSEPTPPNNMSDLAAELFRKNGVLMEAVSQIRELTQAVDL